jgi:tetratricopeptide (TPR) repeat protein
LHTCILQLADKIAKEGKLNMGAFARIWGLENLRPEDYDPYISDDGNSYPSLAERVIQHASKDSFTNDAYEELIYLLPYINDCINRYPDNIWLKLSKARALMATKQSNEAFSYGLEVVKNKINDYWAWELLGDIHQSNSIDLAISCYCKALLCSKDINFVGKVKIKLAELLSKNGLDSEAKLEVDQLVNYRSENNQKIPESAEILMRSTWYQGAISSKSNHQLYLDKATHAEELLYSDLPWINAVLGDTFFIEGKKDKAKRKLYVQSSSLPMEVTIPESKLAFDAGKPGAALKIKGEPDRENRFQVYAIEHRPSNDQWDIFEQQIGIVDHVNTSKKLIHFMISRTIDGVIHFSDLSERFKEGDAISLRLAKYTSRQGTRYRVLTSSRTTNPIPSSILKPFSDDIREENGMGFTDDGIFIPPPLIRENSISDGDFVSGHAVLNYNKKRSEWGWKAISISKVTNNHDI